MLLTSWADDEIGPIASMTDDEATAAIAPNLQRYIGGDLAAGLR